MYKKNIIAALIATLSLAAQAQKNTFNEEFKNNKNKWALPADLSKDSATGKVEKGVFVLNNTQYGTAMCAIKIPNKKINYISDDEVTITATLKHISGTTKVPYSLLLGEVTNAKTYTGYVIGISENNFITYTMKDGKVAIIKKWTASKAIFTGDTANIITVIKKREQFHFLINGQWVFVTNNAFMNVNGIGLLVGNKQKVSLQNIKIESFAKITDKKDQDKINDILTILKQSENNFAKATNSSKSTNDKTITWLPFVNELNKNENLVFYDGYQDNWSYPKAEYDQRIKLFNTYIEKALGKFEKIVKKTPLGQKTYWLSKNDKLPLGSYIAIDEYDLSGNFYIKFIVRIEKDLTAEKVKVQREN